MPRACRERSGARVDTVIFAIYVKCTNPFYIGHEHVFNLGSPTLYCPARGRRRRRFGFEFIN